MVMLEIWDSRQYVELLTALIMYVMAMYEKRVFMTLLTK